MAPDGSTGKTAENVPPHIDDTIRAISELIADHERQIHPAQRFVSSTFAAIGRPAVLLVLTAIVVSWIALNLALKAAGRTPPDPPPFSYLQDAASLAALYFAALIVITQRHDDEVATHRAQLTLQLALLSDQKSAKIIRLLEEFRRNDPAQSDAVDPEAEAMAHPADPQAVMERLRATQSTLRKEG